jgi:hypothetical protein
VRDLPDRVETRRQHARAVLAGTEVRVGHGAYASRADWDLLDHRSRYLLRLRAFAATRSRTPTFSHWSAAIVHGLPVVGPFPEGIHVSVGRTSGGRSARQVVAHSTLVAAEDVVEVAGLRCTSVARTIVDLAAIAPRAQIVPMADHHLRAGTRRRSATGGAGRQDLMAAFRRALPMRGHRRALDVIGFADGRADSPLESVSRVSMHAAGVTQPDLQHPLFDRSGLIGFVDFAWPEARVIGEADGDVKYLDAALRAGRSADRVVLDEKVREDRLRALGWRVVRWRWATASDPGRLGTVLEEAGVPLDRGASWTVCCV